MKLILDCYTDEASGLGVPPYVGVYPRYIAGKILKDTKEKVTYTTIDDFRLWNDYGSKIPPEKQKTNIKIFNLTKNYEHILDIIKQVREIVIVLGVHVPGKYLSAVPGIYPELKKIFETVKKINSKIHVTLTGPGATDFGSNLFGGTTGVSARKVEFIDEIVPNYYTFDEIKIIAPKGAYILNQIQNEYIVELETGVGCIRGVGCSFCTEPLKNKINFREPEDIIAETKALVAEGATRFRLGKQSCFYSYKHRDEKAIEKLLKGISKFKPEVLHIDNSDPNMVNEAVTKLIVKYCTSGNICAFGVESFDPEVVKLNNLNASPEVVYNAMKIVNKYGKERGENGMSKFLPGLNLLFGLAGETKKSHEHNMFWLKKFVDEGLMFRRINIRQVVAFPGTPLYEMKYRIKTKKYYWKWRDEIRKTIDFEMLKQVAPIGTILKDVYLEVHDGNHTFGRQFGTYPLIVGMYERVPTKQFVEIEVTKHQLRSLTGKIVNENK